GRGSAAARGGFTLIEMLISVTLVLLMMALFAQVFGLATETVSTRKGMASNDQKSRLLSNRLGQDLDARTFERVVPFPGATLRYVPVDAAGVPISVSGNDVAGWGPEQEVVEGTVSGPVFQTSDVNPASGIPLHKAAVTETSSADYEPRRRRGIFSISENDPDSDTDDRLTFTTDARKRTRRGDIDFSPVRGRAAVLTTDAQVYSGSGDIAADQPATDVLNVQQPSSDEKLSSSNLVANPAGQAALTGLDGVGVSTYAVVSFYLRGTNLIRSVELVREADTDPALFDADGDGNADNWTPPSGSFRAAFDYAAYRHPDPSQLGPRFHAESTLDNVTGGEWLEGSGERLPKALGVPHLRTGAGVWPFDPLSPTTARSYGRPREFTRKTLGPTLSLDADGNLVDSEWAGLFLGQYSAREQSSPAFLLPGAAPGSRAEHPYFAANLLDRDGDGTADTSSFADVAPWFEPPSPPYPRRGSALRRGEEILMTNVHGFDVEVYDDALGDFADLGHNRTVKTLNLFGIDGRPVTDELEVAGDYHRDRLLPLTPTGDAAIDFDGDGLPDQDGDFSDGISLLHPFGNRFDTWHPGMRLMGRGYVDGDGDPSTDDPVEVTVERPYPPPYRPLRNPLGGDVGVPTRDFDGNPIAPDLSLSGAAGGLVYDDLSGETSTPALLDAFENGDIAQLPLYSPAGGNAVDDNGDGYADTALGATARYPDPNEIGYLGSDDEKPLRAVRITVRYYDVGSDRMREESYRHSLVD
ncbi:type II secretion system protein J, partial [Alienimonas sp. DA493]|uniref:PulJ/GspJ family protein n=1 Tax=Alienimonas sp. DA493 TaxID=3373605 RepID=UPI0037545E57